MSITQEYFDKCNEKLRELKKEYADGLRQFLEENNLDKVVFNKRYKQKGVFRVEVRHGCNDNMPVVCFYPITTKGEISKRVSTYDYHTEWIKEDYEPVKEGE